MEGLTDEQLNQLETNIVKKPIGGFSDDQLSAHESILSKGIEAKQFLDKPWYKQLLTKEFVKELPRGVAQTLIGTPAKFLTSLAEVPYTFATGGKKTDITYKIPGIDPYKSYQTEASDRAGRIIEGKQPVYQALTPFASVPLGGLETSILPGASKIAVVGGKKIMLSLTESIQKGLQSKRLASEAKILKETIDVVSPKLTPTEMNEALASGKVVNRVKPFTKTVIQDFSNDPAMVKIANDTKHIVKPNKTSSENLNLIRQEINETSEYVIKPFFSDNKVPFHYDDFIQKMKLVKPSTSFNNNPTAFQTYNRAREEIIDSVGENLRNISNKNDDYGNLTDFNDIWDARKVLDTKAKNELKNFEFGSPEYTGIKMAVQDMRSAFKDFILDSLQYPGQMDKVNKMQEFLQVFQGRGGRLLNEKEAITLLQKQFGIKNTTKDIARMAFFRDKMEKMTSMYRAIENLSIKARVEQGTNIFKRFGKKHPVIKRGLQIGGGAVGLGVLGTGAASLME